MIKWSLSTKYTNKSDVKYWGPERSIFESSINGQENQKAYHYYQAVKWRLDLGKFLHDGIFHKNNTNVIILTRSNELKHRHKIEEEWAVI